MKRKQIVIDITSNGINLIHNNEIKKYSLTAVDNFKIINSSIFIKEFSDIITKEKINSNILTDNIEIIIDNTYSKMYLSNLENIFKELSFNKIKVININNLINFSLDKIYINISQKNIKIYYQHNVYFIPIYFNNYIDILLLYLEKIIIKKQIKSLILFGSLKNLSNIATNIEKKTNIKTYLYSSPDKIPIRLLLNNIAKK